MEVTCSPADRWTSPSWCPAKLVAAPPIPFEVSGADDLNAVIAGSIHIATSRSPVWLCTGTQTQYRLELRVEFKKVSVKWRMFPPPRDTRVLIAQEEVSRDFNQFVRWRSLKRRFPLARVFVFRESERQCRNASRYARRSRISGRLLLPGGSGSCGLLSIYASFSLCTLPLLGRHISLIP
jgi:hypothetical protein